MNASASMSTDQPRARRSLRRLILLASVGLLSVSMPGLAPVASAQAICGNLVATIEGTAEDDVLLGTPGNDVIAGLTGNDEITGGGGIDTICGGPGIDVIGGSDGADELRGGPGRDILHGGPGADSLFGDDGFDTLTGGLGDDALFGGAGEDLLDGGAGNDTLRGGPDNDFLSSTIGSGADDLRGEAGSDKMIALDGEGDDVIVDRSAGINRCTGDQGDRISQGCTSPLSQQSRDLWTLLHETNDAAKQAADVEELADHLAQQYRALADDLEQFTKSQ